MILVLALVGCGKDDNRHTTVNQVVVVDAKAQDFEGVYHFDNGGFIELIAASDGDVTVLSQGQILTSVNPENDTFAQHPTISRVNEEVVDGSVRFSVNLNYTSGHDLEEDVSGANVLGQKRTDVLIQVLESGKLKITLTVYSDKLSNNANYVVAVRSFESL
jgi:hypothetical protein